MSIPADSAPSAALQDLFEQALALEPAARAAWLSGLKRSAPDRAAQLECLLAHDGDDPFGDAVDAMRESLQEDEARWIGRDVGAFHVLRALGGGGMGQVFLAERRGCDFHQLVALKLLRARVLDGATLEHFARERRILARLRHPHIATLIDAGSTPAGQPYLAMEYVEGSGLAEYSDTERLGLAARVTLARQLLGALAYAHRALVVHRDLKPGNVLVSADGSPKLLDFGIARLLDQEGEAGAEATRAWTPAYASPEQLAGEPAGTASDLYSFGLLLYELCVGVLPWDSEARQTMATTRPARASARFQHLDAQRRAELAARRNTTPGHVRRRLRGDLGRVLARCLKADPAHRYASADALDIDLAAWLANRSPPGVQVPTAARAAAFVRRHALPVTLAAVVLLAGVVLLAQAQLAARHLQAERDRALASAHTAEIAAAKSEQIAHFVQAMLGGIDPEQARGMDRRLMRLVLDSAAQRAQTELAGQPAVRMAIERTIADSYSAIGEYGRAVKHFDLALAATAKLPDDRATRATRVALLAHKARAVGSPGANDRALQLAQDAVTLAQALPPDTPERLYAETTLATAECSAGRFAACRKRYARVYARQRQLWGEDANRTLITAEGLAAAEDGLGHAASAQSLYRAIIAARQRDSAAPTAAKLDVINALAISYLRQKQYVAAELLLRPAVKQAEALFGPDHPVTINMLSNLGGAIRQQPGRNAEARPYYERTLAATNARYGADTQRSVYAEMNLALLLRDAGQLKAAEEHARAALRRAQTLFPADNPILATLQGHLGSILVRAGRLDEGKALLTDAYRTLAATPGYTADQPWMRQLIEYRIALYKALGQPAEVARWQAKLAPDAGRDDAAAPVAPRH